MRQVGGSLGCWEYMAYLEREVLLSEGAFFPPRIHSKFKDLENGNQEHAIRLKHSSTSLRERKLRREFHRDLRGRSHLSKLLQTDEDRLIGSEKSGYCLAHAT